MLALWNFRPPHCVLLTLDNTNASRYYMIKTFRDKETEKIWFGDISYKYDVYLQPKIRRKLAMLHLSSRLVDLSKPSSNRLEKLRGNRKDEYSVRVNKQYRICFEWLDGDCYNVQVIDYH